MKKRMLTCLLLLSMLISLLPMAAYAENSSEEIPAEDTEFTEEFSEEVPNDSEETLAENENAESGEETEAVVPDELEDITGQEVTVMEGIELNASSGSCGDNLTWTLTDDGTLTISGTGSMRSYATEDSPWDEDNSSILKIVITNGVTSIGGGAFYCCNNLSSVTLPNSLTKIEDAAFMHCSSLKSISIPSSVTAIGDNVFDYCSSLSEINVDSNNKVYSSVNGVLFKETPRNANLKIWQGQ